MMYSIDQLLDYIEHRGPYDAIVVEGYDGVGKGRILNILSEYLGVMPYRPDYNLWQKYNHPQPDRWKISGFFWDVFSHFTLSEGIRNKPFLFDRGVISGAVYNNDPAIAKDYSLMLRNAKVLHILIQCELRDYVLFMQSRSNDVSIYDSHKMYEDYQLYTSRYLEFLDLSGVEYISLYNSYDENLGLSDKCEGCGHYSYGWCRHPLLNKEVDSSQKRCSLSKDKEVQDTDVTSMHCV